MRGVRDNSPILESRIEAMEMRLGIKPSPFPNGMSEFFWEMDAPAPEEAYPAKEPFAQASTTLLIFRNKRCVLVDAPFGCDSEQVVGQEVSGHFFVKQWVYKGYKSPGETWTTKISGKNIRENIGLLKEEEK